MERFEVSGAGVRAEPWNFTGISANLHSSIVIWSLGCDEMPVKSTELMPDGSSSLHIFV
jgi:hypothetical protein